MRTALEIIHQERFEQINKHGYSLVWQMAHPEYYENDELVNAAKFCINPEEKQWPLLWDDSAAIKIKNKDRIGQLACAGAFLLSHEEMFGKSTEISNMLRLCDLKIQERLDYPERFN